MSLSQYAFLRYIKKQGVIEKRHCDDAETEMLSYFMSLNYIECIKDDTDYQNATQFYKLTPHGERALADRFRLSIATAISIIALILSAASIILDILGI